MPLQAVAATAAQKFVDTIGVNTHIDFTQNAYGNFAAVQRALAYLGVKSVRDAYQNPADGAKFTSLHNDLGISFDLFIGPLPDGPEPYATQLQQIESLAPGVVASVEGVNEPDIFGRSLSDATAFQQTLYASVHANMPGIPVLQLTFGNVDDYGITGDQSAFADFANAHTFFGSGNNPAFQNWIGTLNADALRTTPRKPIIVTESGYTTSGSTTNQHDVNDVEQAKYTLDITLDMFKAGDVRTYLYELLDEQTGSTERENTFGLFFSDGTPKPSGTAVHNLISLLSDARAATAPPPGALTYSLGGMPNTGNSLLMQKSDGYWLAVWNDVRLSGPSTPTPITVPPVPMTLALGARYASVQIFDPLNGTTPIASFSNTDAIAFNLPDHPVIIKVSGAATADTPGPHVIVPTGEQVNAGGTVLANAAQVIDAFAASHPGSMVLNVSDSAGALGMNGAGGALLPGSGTHAMSFSGTFAQVNAALATLTYTAGSATGKDSISINVWDQAGLSTTQAIPVAINPAPPPPPGPQLTLPSSETVAASTSFAITGVKIADAFAAGNPGAMALNVSDSTGKLTMRNAAGTALAGSGTTSISFSGTLPQLNAALATLTYASGATAGSDDITIGVWDQAGLFSSGDILVTVGGSPPPPPPPPPPSSSIAAPATEQVAAGGTVAVSGVQVRDTFAAGNPGNMAVNLNAGSGHISVLSSTGTPLPGSGTASISFSGTFAQVNAELATLRYTAGATAGTDSISFDVWDQAGTELTAVTAVTITGGASAPITAATLQSPASPSFAAATAPASADTMPTMPLALTSADMTSVPTAAGTATPDMTAGVPAMAMADTTTAPILLPHLPGQ